MRTRTSTWKLFRRAAAVIGLVVVLAVSASASPPVAHGATFTVNTTSNTDDGTCNPSHCSLREAINAANALGGPDIIAFSIGAGGSQRIDVAGSPLPTITAPLTIDGTTQPGYATTPLIEIDGTAGQVGLICCGGGEHQGAVNY